jgi:hypothetical protein
MLVEKMHDDECEVLYGRCGYLRAVHFVRHHTDDPGFGEAHARKIVAQVLHAGRRDAARAREEGGADGEDGLPLLYRWKGKCYFGAAHGVAGIVQTLLDFPAALTADDEATRRTRVRRRWASASAQAAHESAGTLGSLARLAQTTAARRDGDAETRAPRAAGAAGAAGGACGACDLTPRAPAGQATEQLVACVDWILERAFDGGNIPSSEASRVGGGKDRLVQWCHGAPGFVPALCACARVRQAQGDAAAALRYVAAAERLGEVVWARGLLHKGLGLCHGVSGNGYAFLSIAASLAALPEEAAGRGGGGVGGRKRFGDGSTRPKTRAERRALWLRRARAFALFGTDDAVFEAVEDVPDQPLSLFNGLAGAAVFCCDVLHPEEARFPGM